MAKLNNIIVTISCVSVLTGTMKYNDTLKAITGKYRYHFILVNISLYIYISPPARKKQKEYIKLVLDKLKYIEQMKLRTIDTVKAHQARDLRSINMQKKGKIR